MPGAFAFQRADGSAFLMVAPCDSLTLGGAEWTAETYTDYEVDNFTNIRREGTNLIEIATTVSGGDTTQYVRKTYAAAAEVDITADDFHIWFLYTGKGTEFLFTDASATRMRFHSGATADVNYIEFDLSGAVTAGFFPPLFKSWNALHASGSHATTSVGTPVLTLIRHLDFRTRSQVSNSGNQQPDFAIDYAKVGSKIQITLGTSPDPVRQADIQAWNDIGANPSTDPDEGLTQLENIFLRLRAGLDFGNGSTVTWVVFENLTIFNDQFSSDVPHNWVVENAARLRLGLKVEEIQSTYAISGCVVSIPLIYRDGFLGYSTGLDPLPRTTDLIVQGGASFTNQFEAYATKFQNWNDILLGQVAGEPGTVDLLEDDFDSNRNIEFRAALDAVRCKFHDPFPTWLNAGRAWQYDLSLDTYTEVTTEWNSATGATNFFPNPVAIGDAHLWGFSQRFSWSFISVVTGSTGTPTFAFEYWNGTSWQGFPTIFDGTFNFVINGLLLFGRPSDWATLSINATAALFYVRVRVIVTPTNQPTFRAGRVGQTRLGSLFVAPNSLEGSQFFRCDRALRFAISTTVREYIATDNFYDAVLDDVITVNFVNSRVDPNKLLQI